MHIIKENYNNINIKEPLTIAIGNFDGLHLGHKALINEVLKFQDTKSAVLTFSPHTLQYFKVKDFKILTTDTDKLRKSAKFNLDYFIFVNFNQDFASLDEITFVQFLQAINVKRIVLGSDAKFGKGGSINKNVLKNHFEVIEINDLIIDQKRISSTYIKTLLQAGNIELANKYLNENYQIIGTVTHGNKVGTKLGFPTANVLYNNYFLPKNGVYFVKVYDHYGICNIGNNPSINYSPNKRLEVHIFDYKNDLYGETIQIEFIKYLRDEKKFNTKEELINQLKLDEKIARSMI